MDIRKFVLRQTGIVALGELIGTGALVGIFALLGKYDTAVLLGGIVGALAATGNFLAMAIGVNAAADKAEKQNVKGGEATIRGSFLLRMAVLFVVLFAFAKSGLCNPITLVVPLVFVRFTLTIAEFFRRKPGDQAV